MNDLVVFIFRDLIGVSFIAVLIILIPLSVLWLTNRYYRDKAWEKEK